MADYSSIRVSTLRGDQKIPFNAYVKVAGKFILLCREGDSFEGDRLERLRGKKIVKMFIPEDQRPAYDAYMRENIDRAYSNTKKRPLEIRTQIIHGALQAVAEDVIESPDAAAFYQVALDGAKRFVKFFKEEPESLAAILNMKNYDFSIAHHGVIVAALALAICQENGLAEERPMQLEALVLGSLIHDIEHNYNNLNRSVKQELYSRPEKLIYLRHCTEGYERIKEFHHFDPLVREIVLNHEEKLDGSGPRKRREKDLDPFAMVVGAANTFDLLLTYEDVNPKEAMKKLLIDRMGALQLDAMKGLQSALKKRGII